MGRGNRRHALDLGLPVEVGDDNPATCGNPYVGLRPALPPVEDLRRVGRGRFLPFLDSRVLPWRFAGASAATGASGRRVARKDAPAAARILESVIDQQATTPCAIRRSMLLERFFLPLRPLHRRWPRAFGGFLLRTMTVARLARFPQQSFAQQYFFLDCSTFTHAWRRAYS